MDLKQFKGPIIGAVASLITATIVGAFSAFLALKDSLAEQKVAITKLTEDIKTLETTVATMSGNVDEWNRSSLLVLRHDDYLKKLGDILSESPALRTTGAESNLMVAKPTVIRKYNKDAPRLRLFSTGPKQLEEIKKEELPPELEWSQEIDESVQEELR